MASANPVALFIGWVRGFGTWGGDDVSYKLVAAGGKKVTIENAGVVLHSIAAYLRASLEHVSHAAQWSAKHGLRVVSVTPARRLLTLIYEGKTYTVKIVYSTDDVVDGVANTRWISRDGGYTGWEVVELQGARTLGGRGNVSHKAFALTVRPLEGGPVPRRLHSMLRRAVEDLRHGRVPVDPSLPKTPHGSAYGEFPVEFTELPTRR